MKKSEFNIFDSHCHIQFPIYDNDREAVIGRAREAGVKMIVAGSQISTSEVAIELAHKYPEDIWATVGFHPSHAVIGGWHHDKNEQKESAPENFDIKKIRELAIDPKVVGIGECGLDYYRLGTSDPRTEAELGAGHSKRQETSIKNAQKEVFKKMTDLAAELKKPLIIHCRPSIGSNDAYMDLLEILEEKKFNQNIVMHCFTGSVEIARKFLEAGFYPHTRTGLVKNNPAEPDKNPFGVGVYFTLGGAVTFPSKIDKKKCAYDDVINYLPLDRIMTETDCPYIAPVPYRGSRNEPAYVIETAKKIAEIKNIGIDEFKKVVCRNVSRVFKISI